MDIHNKRILVLAPHTDDGEFGCGGTIHRLLSQSCQVRYVAFSDCKESVPEGYPNDTLEKEMREATKLLGIPKDQVELKYYPVRKFSDFRQNILEDLVTLKRNYNPDIIFTPSRKDIHQDHAAVTQECIRAFKESTILGYELPWNLLELPSEIVISLNETNVEHKIQAIQAYKSQRFRPYSSPDYIKALAITRGNRIRTNFAEAFECIRIIVR